LNFDIVPDYNVIGYKHILTQTAIFSNQSLWHYVTKMPHLGVFANNTSFIYEGSWMNKSGLGNTQL